MLTPKATTVFNLNPSTLRGGAAVRLCAALVAAIGISTPAWALPVYAQQTGLPCGRCHINPEGGGPRTARGKAFAANGHQLRGHRHDDQHGPGMMEGYGHGMMGGYGHGMMGQDW